MSDDDATAADLRPGAGAHEGDHNFWVSPTRLLALTDGVVAIAMTLLALDLAPDITDSDLSTAQLWEAISERSGSFIAFFIAFALIAEYWIVHHRLLRSVDRHDLKLTWANMLFLLGITLLPVTTSLLGQTGTPLAITFYAGDLILISAALGVIGLIVDRGRLRRDPVPEQDLRLGYIRSVTTMVIPLIVIAVAWVTGHGASWLFFLYLLTGVPGRIASRRQSRPART